MFQLPGLTQAFMGCLLEEDQELSQEHTMLHRWYSAPGSNGI